MRVRCPLARFLAGLTAAALLLAGAPAAFADYWVAVGAYRGLPRAQAAAASAGGKVPLQFSVVPAVTPAGERVYRVASGPYANWAEADAVVAQVRTAGFGDGWIVKAEGAAAEGAAVAAPARSAPVADIDDILGGSVLAEELLDPAVLDALIEAQAAAANLPPIELLLRDLPDAPAPPSPTPSIEDTAEEAEMVAPDDYHLHELHRGGAMLDSRSRRGAPSARGSGAAAGGAGEFDMRLKWFTTAQSLPAGDALRRATGESRPVDHNGDLRLMWSGSVGALAFTAHHASTWMEGDSLAVAAAPGLTFDQTPLGDDRRLMDLTWDVDVGDGQRALHRFDRLALEYRGRALRVSLGRQALSWGAGLVFQPMDLFNPFAPTTVDQDYKAGDDMLVVERLLPSGADLQLLAVGRRSAGGDADVDASSFAAKFRTGVGDNELELMASQHYGGQVYGLGVRIPIGGALVRSDVTFTRDHGDLTLSGLINADYSFSVLDSPVHVFGELFHNGFGATRLPADLGGLPQPLLIRIGRGELFNLMRNYAAIGTTFRWHFLVSQSLALIANLHDGSYVAQASLSYDVSDASRLQLGITKPVGNDGDEFGGLTVGEDVTAGGGARGFLRFVYFW